MAYNLRRLPEQLIGYHKREFKGLNEVQVLKRLGLRLGVESKGNSSFEGIGS